MVEIPYYYCSGHRYVEVTKDAPRFHTSEHHAKKALRSSCQAEALLNSLIDRCKFKEENWQNNTNLRGEDSATSLLTLLSTGLAVKNENEVTRLACELALLALGNTQEWLKAEVGSCKDYGRQLVIAKTIAGKGDVCKQALFDSAYNTANLFGPIPTILSEKVTSDLNGSRYHVDFHA